MRKIRAIVKRPDEVYGHVCHVSDSLQNLQKTVGGYIEMVYLTDDVAVICNEEGLIRNLPYNMKVHKTELHGTIIVIGLKMDEFTDLEMTFNDWKYLVDVFNSEDKLKVPQNCGDLIWHVINEDDPGTFPKTDDYILLNFANASVPSIGRCEGNEDEGFAFFDGDDETPLIQMGFIVNAWMPLPKRMEME